MKRVRRSSPAGEPLVYRDSAAGTFLSGVTSSVSAEKTPVETASESQLEREPRAKFERAVWAHIQAVRALGRTQINTIEIAEALSIPVQKVNSVLDQLRKKGVRPL